MEPLIAQLKSLVEKVRTDPGAQKTALLAGAVLAGLVVVGTVASQSLAPHYEYVFTNLDQQEQTDATAILRKAGIPFRVEAEGQAIAVPSSEVFDARILLASEGIPKKAGTGFELFDHGDLGVSEFTQKVNLRRAVEGELARTISGLSEVKSARVHIRFPERRLFQKGDEGAAASVAVQLFAGRTLRADQVRGVQHLVSSAVPGLGVDAVSVIDGTGRPLSEEAGSPTSRAQYQRDYENDLEQRVVSVLEPVVGMGAVVAEIAAEFDATEVDSQEETYDADNPATRSVQTSLQQKATPGQAQGVAGAQGNMVGGAQTGQGGQLVSSNDVKNYELSKKVVRKVDTLPRITRLSVAVLVHETDPARAPEELARLKDLVRRAVGFNDERGDQIEVTALPFTELPPSAQSANRGAEEDGSTLQTGLVAAGVLLLLAGAVVVFLRRRKGAVDEVSVAVLSAGGTVKDLESAIDRTQMIRAHGGDTPLLAHADEADDEDDKVELTPEQMLLERARTLTQQEPARAAHLLRAWLETDHSLEAHHG